MKESFTAVAFLGFFAAIYGAEVHDIAPDVIATVVECDVTAKRPDAVEPILSTIEIRKRSGAFHLTIDGDHFDATRRLLMQMLGEPMALNVTPEDGRREARFRACALVFNQSRGETVVFGFGKRPEVNAEKSNQPAALVERVDPVYPAELRHRGIEGRVLVGFVVSSVGMVRDVYIVTPADAAFEKAAVQAVLQWRYIPAMVEGRSTNVRMQELIVFEIPKEKE